MLPLPALLAAVTVVTCLSPPARASNITCRTGVFAGQAGGAFLTCHFQEDLRKTRRNFNVYHFPFNQVGEADLQNGNEIVLCNWIRGKEELECEKKAGFVFDRNVSDHLTVGFPPVTREAAGSYICQLVPDQSDTVVPCTLHVSDPNTHESSADKAYPSPADIQQGIDQHPHDLGRHSQSETGSASDAVIGLSIALAVLVIVIVTGLVFYYCKKFKLGPRSGSKSKPPNLPHPYDHELYGYDIKPELLNAGLDYEQSVPLKSQPTENEDSRGCQDLTEYSKPNKTTEAATPMTQGIDLEDLALTNKLESGSDHPDSSVVEEHDHYEKIAGVEPQQEHNGRLKQKVVLAWTTQDLCNFLKSDGGFDDQVIGAFEKEMVTGANFDQFDYRTALTGSNVNELHLKRLGSLLDDLKTTRDSQFLDKTGTYRTDVVIMV